MKRFLMTAMMVAASVGLMNAQTVHRQVVEEGGTGPFKSRYRLCQRCLLQQQCGDATPVE